MKQDYITAMRRGEDYSVFRLLALTIRLSIPTILAQLSLIVMEYADAAMVGRLGGNATAAIGLVASSTWLLGGLCNSAVIGFTVQVSQAIGAGDEQGARRIMKQGFVASLLFSAALGLLGAGVHSFLPGWLGGDAAITADAARYFLVFSLFLPFQMFNVLAAGLLQSSGNMRTPGILEILMCFLNIGYNYLFIYVFPFGVTGAAVGTGLAEVTIALPMAFFLFQRSPALHLRRGEGLHFVREELTRAVKIALPVCFEQTVMCSAYIMSTRIVSPLGAVSVAAHSLSITAEGLCYMPGYGIGAAATAMIGQTVGAKRDDLNKRIGWMATVFGMALMGLSGLAMYALAPTLLRWLTPVEEISTLAASVLRIEVFAEPMYAASIVALGVFRGRGDTLVPSMINLFSMWAVRLPLSAWLAGSLGLKGVWIAMTAELCFRGVIFLLRMTLKSKKGNAYETQTQRQLDAE